MDRFSNHCPSVFQPFCCACHHEPSLFPPLCSRGCMLAADPSGVIFQPSVFRRESQKTSFSSTSFSQQVPLLGSIIWNYLCLFLFFITQVGEVHMLKSEDNVKEYFSSTVGSRAWAQLIISPAQISSMSYWKNCARKPFLNQLAAQRWHRKLGLRVITLSVLELGDAEHSWLRVLAISCWLRWLDNNYLTKTGWWQMLYGGLWFESTARHGGEAVVAGAGGS